MICLYQIGYSQSIDSYIIREIQYEGLKNTKVEYVSNFVHSEVGAQVVDQLLEADVQRLKNIISIGNANYRLDSLHNGVKVVFEVEEIRTLLPILNSGGIKDNFWLQVGVSNINWRGLGQHLSVIYQNSDQRHSGSAFFKVPRIKDTQWGYSGAISRFASREPLFFRSESAIYEYTNDALGLSAIRHLGINRNIELGGTYFVETYRREADGSIEYANLPQFLRQPEWLLKFLYQEDHLNYDLFYLDGLKWHFNSQFVYNTLDNNWFYSFQFQGKYYKRTSRKGNLATRIRVGLSQNNESPFAPFVADSHVNIRGIGNRIDRGTAQIILNTEYRHSFHQTNKWGAQFVSFSDIGTWRNPGGSLRDLLNPDQFRIFVGAGLRLIYHKIYGAVLRIDYAVDLTNSSQRGFVIGLGQYF